MTTYPRPADPLSALTRADGTTEPHSKDHGQLIGAPLSCKGYGVVGDGVADDTAALQTWLDALITATAAASTTRTAVATGYWAPGSYKITAPLVIKSVEGLRIMGAGSQATKLLPAANMASVLSLNGLAICEIEGIGIWPTLQGATTVTNPIDLFWDSASAFRSTTDVAFRDIFVGCVWTEAAFRTARPSNTAQVDSILFENCHASGNYSGTANYTNGFYFGIGAPANALGHTLIGCEVLKTKYGIQTQGVSFAWYGGQFAGTSLALANTVTVWVSGSPKQLLVEGVRVEGYRRFIGTNQWATDTRITLSSIEFRFDVLEADGYWGYINCAGSHRLSNVSVYGNTGYTTTSATFLVGPTLGYSHTIIDGLGGPDVTAFSAMILASNVRATYTARGLYQIASGPDATAFQPGTFVGNSTTYVIANLIGTGTPEAVVSAPPGSDYRDYTNGEAYVKVTGSGNVGWKKVTHA